MTEYFKGEGIDEDLKSSFDDLDFSALQLLQNFTKVFTHALNMLETRKQRTLHMVVPTFCSIYDQLVNLYLFDNSGLSEMAKIAIEICDEYMDGCTSKHIKPRLTPEMFTLEYLNPLSNKLGVFTESIQDRCHKIWPIFSLYNINVPYYLIAISLVFLFYDNKLRKKLTHKIIPTTLFRPQLKRF